MMRQRTPASELTLGHVRTVPGNAVGHAMALITSAISRAGPASHARETLVPQNVLERLLLACGLFSEHSSRSRSVA
jgi:hypothetical protein